MPHVEGGAAVIRHGIVLVGEKACRTGGTAVKKSPRIASGTGVALGVAQSVEAEQRKPPACSKPDVRDQLFLAEHSTGGVLIDVLIGAVRRGSAGDIRRIDVVNIQRMLTA